MIREAIMSDPQRGRRHPGADRRGSPRAAAGRPHQRAGRGRVHRRGRRRCTACPTPRSTRSPCCCSRPARARRGSRWASPWPRCFERPEVLRRGCATTVRLLRPAIEESLRLDADRPDVLAPRHAMTSSSSGLHAPAGLGDPPLPRRREPRPGALGAARRVRHHPAAEAIARVRQRPARVPRHARRPRGDDRRHQRAARPAAATCGSIPTPNRPATSACTNAARQRSRSCSDDRVQRARLHRRPTSRLLGEEHIRRYRETDGEVGYLWNGVPTLLLTTTGRRSGEPRTSALIFGRDGDDYLVVASMGGAPKHPTWYLNLTANPAAEIQVQGDRIPVDRAHRVGRREAAPLADRDRGVAQLRRVPDPHRPARSRSSCCRRRELGRRRRRRPGPSASPTGRRRCNARGPGRWSRRS